MKCIIIGGAPAAQYDTLKGYIHEGDYIICCDSGLYLAEKLGVEPQLIVGDFDSHPMPQTDTETIVLARKKDDTDTMHALKEAIDRGCDEFVLLGVCGGRLDHTFANLSMLVWLYKSGMSAVAVDDYGEMQIVGKELVSIDKSFAYFSLVNVCGDACGVTVTGAEYPLHDACLRCESQYAVSNEVTGKCAVVCVNDGCMLLIKIRGTVS